MQYCLHVAVQAWADRLASPRLSLVQLRRVTTSVTAFIGDSGPPLRLLTSVSSTQHPVDLSPVEFYEATVGQYGSFCNFHPSPIRVDGVQYPTVEHFYHCQKFTDAQYRDLIRTASTPNQAKIFARQKAGGGYKWRVAMNDTIKAHLARGVQLRKDWEEVKDGVMFKGLQAKFTQHRELAARLTETGERPIVEVSPRDYYWGCGSDRTGQNKLGKLLVNIRAFLRKRDKLRARGLLSSSDELSAKRVKVL